MVFKQPDPSRVQKLLPIIDKVQKARWSLDAARRVFDNTQHELRVAVGPGHVFTNESCRINKSGGHIYNNSIWGTGVGHRNCVLCGEDDFDF